jgi:transposase InsO family protein
MINRIKGCHTDNGSEFINATVARLLEKLLIEQTKSRPRQSGALWYRTLNTIPFRTRLVSA